MLSMYSFLVFLNESCYFSLEIHPKFWLLLRFTISYPIALYKMPEALASQAPQDIHPELWAMTKGITAVPLTIGSRRYRCLAWPALNGRLCCSAEQIQPKPQSAFCGFLYFPMAFTPAD